MCGRMQLEGEATVRAWGGREGGTRARERGNNEYGAHAPWQRTCLTVRAAQFAGLSTSPLRDDEVRVLPGGQGGCPTPLAPNNAPLAMSRASQRRLDTPRAYQNAFWGIMGPSPAFLRPLGHSTPPPRSGPGVGVSLAPPGGRNKLLPRARPPSEREPAQNNAGVPA